MGFLGSLISAAVYRQFKWTILQEELPFLTFKLRDDHVDLFALMRLARHIRAWELRSDRGMMQHIRRSIGHSIIAMMVIIILPGHVCSTGLASCCYSAGVHAYS